jgi:dTDP-4-dehydrorhamnose 3,5-epimerase
MNPKVFKTHLPGCIEFHPCRVTDDRGIFVKTYHRGWFEELGLNNDWAEQYYSVSQQGVVRGLHFQLPPHDHAKLIYCIAGRVFDIALDLRVDSPTYGEHISIELRADLANMVYLPSGLAHGFSTFDEPATLVYNVTSVYHPESDTGIRWDTAGIVWPHKNPLLSERDLGFPSLDEFKNPFRFEASLSEEVSQ